MVSFLYKSSSLFNFLEILTLCDLFWEVIPHLGQKVETLPSSQLEKVSSWSHVVFTVSLQKHCTAPLLSLALSRYELGESDFLHHRSMQKIRKATQWGNTGGGSTWRVPRGCQISGYSDQLIPILRCGMYIQLLLVVGGLSWWCTLWGIYSRSATFPEGC